VEILKLNCLAAPDSIIFIMKKDKTSMSTAVLHMLKMQIKAEANQLREIKQPSFTVKTPTQKRHFQQQHVETLPA
jgi:hypothetical protein